MAPAEKGRRSGSERQAAGLVAPSAAFAANARAAIDRSGSLLAHAKPLRLGRGAGSMEAAGNGLVRDLDRACAEIARQKRQSSGSAAPTSRQTAAATAMSPAERALQKLQATAHAKVLQERAERLTAENAVLSQKLAAREGALADLRARLNSLEEKLSATGEAAAKHADDKQDAPRAASDHLHKKLAAMASENARLALTATERDRALTDARTRIEYLEAALAAAEAECGRIAGETSGAREKHQAEMAARETRFDDMSKRAVTAEQLLADARERLLARIIEIDAMRQRVAQADAAADAAYDRQRQLEDALCLQQQQFEEFERSQTQLAGATKALLQRFRDRERALSVAEEKIKALAERNARLEAAQDRAGGPAQRGRETPRSHLEEAADATLADWSELARLVGDFAERKTATTPATRRVRSAA
jgi:fused signal recognition particle receptor